MVSKDSILLTPLLEQQALNHVENWVVYKNNRYTVRSLCKENQPSLPCKKPLALSKFSYLEKKFDQNPKFTNKYKETIKD